MKPYLRAAIDTLRHHSKDFRVYSSAPTSLCASMMDGRSSTQGTLMNAITRTATALTLTSARSDASRNPDSPYWARHFPTVLSHYRRSDPRIWSISDPQGRESTLLGIPVFSLSWLLQDQVNEPWCPSLMMKTQPSP